jgi:hypothetical protein
MNSSWHFGESQAGEKEGFNASGISMFAGDSVESLTREVIQNSLDAREDKKLPVKVRFDLIDLDSEKAPEIYALQQWIELGEEAESKLNMNSKVGRDFYTAARRTLQNKRNIKVLAIHDANTRGLGGPLRTNRDSKDGGWISLVKSAGITNKQGDDALGSFGQGAKAPFALSGLRTVFYYTRTEDGTPLQTRFQGKSILQSMWLDSERFTGKVGFFGKLQRDNHCEALLDNEVPRWAVESRSKQFDANGTSIFVPAPGGAENTNNFWLGIKIAVLANFYFAISQNHLFVEFGDGQVLDQDSLDSVFSALVIERVDEIRQFSEKVQDALESSKTIQFAQGNPELHGVFESKPFGEISWFLRLGETVSGRNVGIARQNGMLITREAEKLKKFNSLKPFDLFLCVVGTKGSTILRSFENPEHNTFDFGRINDPTERKASKTAYEKFAAEIRELLINKVSTQVSQEVKTSDLNHLFGGSATDGSGDLPDESSARMMLAKPKKRPVVAGEKVRIESEDIEPAGGNSGGDGVLRSTGGNVPGHGQSDTAPVPTFIGRQVEELRISAADSEGFVKIFFTPTVKGSGILRLFKSGTADRAPVPVQRPGGSEDWIAEIPFEATSTSRKTLRLRFKSQDLEYSIEAVLLYAN